MPSAPAAPRIPAGVSEAPPFLSSKVKVWIKGGLLGIAAVVGLMIASGAHGAGFAYFGGIFFALLCVLALFRLITRQFDEPDSPSPLVPVPEDSTARLVRGGVAAVVFVVALVLAAGAHGAGFAYYGGLFAAGGAVFYIFYLIRMSVGGEEAR